MARSYSNRNSSSMLDRARSAWGAMSREQRLAGLASLGLLVSMFLPWYELQSLNRRTSVISSHSINAFGDVSFVEAAIFLVAIAVMALLFARAERRDFHMPGSDGTIVMIAGCWAALLIFYRVFSRPSGHGYPVGIQWGFFLAFVAAGGVAYGGWRMRLTQRPEPPFVHITDQHSSASPPVPATESAARSRYPPPPALVPRRASRRASTAQAEQLSFENQPTDEPAGEADRPPSSRE
jgi:hypothetical protein